MRTDPRGKHWTGELLAGHTGTIIARSYYRESTNESAIARQDKTPTVEEIQRPAREDYEVLGAVCWRPGDSEFLA